MIWEYIRLSIFFSFIFFTLFFVAKQKYEALLWLYFFTFPFQNCTQYFITTWQPYKIVSLGMLFLIMTNHKKNIRLVPNKIKNLFLFFIFILFLSNLIAVIFPPSYNGYSPLLRLLIQDFIYLLGFTPLFYTRYLPYNFIDKSYNKYCIAMELTIVIGLIHYLFLKLGIPFLPLYRDAIGTFSDTVMTEFGGSIVGRVYGFCGEPKNMAFFIVPYIVISYIAFLQKKIRYNKIYHVLFLLLSLFILIQTYSSAAFIELVISFPIVLYIYYVRTANITKMISAMILFCICLFLITLLKGDNIDSFFDSYYERSFGRATQELDNGRQEVTIYNKYIHEEDITYLLFGYGVAQYSYHNNMIISGTSIVPVQSGLILHLVDFGFVGYLYLFVFLEFSVSLLRKILKKPSLYPILFWIGAMATFIGDTMYSMIGNLVTGPILLLSLSYWAAENEKYLNNFNNNRISDLNK